MCILLAFAGVILIVRPQLIFGHSENTAQDAQILHYTLGIIGTIANSFLVAIIAGLNTPLKGKTTVAIMLQYYYVCTVVFAGLIMVVRG